MVETEDLKRIIKVCMFDQYGTVVDMQAGLTEIATPYLKAKGWTGNPYSFVTCGISTRPMALSASKSGRVASGAKKFWNSDL